MVICAGNSRGSQPGDRAPSVSPRSKLNIQLCTFQYDRGPLRDQRPFVVLGGPRREAGVSAGRGVTSVQPREPSLNLASCGWSQRNMEPSGELSSQRAEVVKKGELSVQCQVGQCIDGAVVPRLDNLLIQSR